MMAQPAWLEWPCEGGTRVSPRPAPTRHDETAKRFLAAAAQLIDVYLHADPQRREQSVRLKQIHFPAALEWLRTEDVIRMAGAKSRKGASRKAFFNRWPAREEFLPDALVYAFLRKYEADDPQEYIDQVPDMARHPASFVKEFIRITEGLLAALLRHPRSYLALHLGPLLPHHPELWEVLLPEIQRAIHGWTVGYAHIVAALGLTLRPEWSARRVSLVLQAMLDGFVLRYRIQPNDYSNARYEDTSIFADSVIAFILGVVDWEKAGVTGRVALDRLVRKVSDRE